MTTSQVRTVVASSLSLSLLYLALQSPAVADDSGGNFLTIPFRAAAAVAGTPIAIAREIPHQFKLCLGEYKEDNNSWKIIGATGTLAVAPIASVIKGCIAGPKNAFKHPAFSKDSFSLGELDDK